jgi:biopolymer transport protein ExbD
MRIESPARRRNLLRPMVAMYVVFIPLLFCVLSVTFLRYANLHIAGPALAAGDQPSAVLRIESRGVVTVDGQRSSLAGLEGAIRKMDPPFGSTVIVSGRGGSVEDLVAVTDALREMGVSTLLIDR